MNPSNEQRTETEPQQCGEPSPLDSKDRPDHRCCACNGFELVTEEDVFAGGHEFHSVHKHLSWSGFFGIRLYNLCIDIFGIDSIPNEKDDEPYNDNIN